MKTATHKAEPFMDMDGNWHNADGSWASEEQSLEYQRAYDANDGANNNNDENDEQEESRPRRGRPPGRRTTQNHSNQNRDNNRTLFTVLGEIRDVQEKLDSLVNELNDIVSPLSRLMGVPTSANQPREKDDDNFQTRSAAKQSNGSSSTQAGIHHKSAGQGRVTDPEHDKRLKPETRQQLMDEQDNDDNDD